MDNIAYLLALHSVKGLGPIRLKHLLDYYHNPKIIWQTSPKELVSLGIPPRVTEELAETRKKLEPLKYLETIQKSNIKWVTVFDDNYPTLLKEIYDPPVVLFYQGDLEKADGKNIAVVGTRKITSYGKLVTEKITEGLVSGGLTIVSGLAEGVDTVAHQTAVGNQGQTIAVLGGGLNKIYPAQNTGLAKQIIDSGLGALVSEFPPDEDSLPGNFPARNRIISGLSKAVLVTEAARDSGSLITAKCALEQGREVFAVPGPITSDYSKGPIFLIKQGAKLVTEAAEILEELGIRPNQRLKVKDQQEVNLSLVEEKILECLRNENKQVDEVCLELKLPSAVISAGLVKMEIYGLVQNLGGGIYTKI